MFILEKDRKNLKIFFRLNIHEYINDKEIIISDNTKIIFGKYFKRIVKRTGKHCQQSHALHNLKFLENISTAGKYNYHIFPLIYPEIFNNPN